MKYKLFFPLLTLLVLVFALGYKSDDDPFAALLKKLETYLEKYPQEKVHIHLDKPYYAIGDDIWVKAYVMNAQTSAPSSISSAIYVELLNEKDSIKQQLKLPLVSGLSWGDFKLPDSLAEGNYRIRAYTQWMKNAGTEFFFDKIIKIGNSWSNSVFTSTNYAFSKQNAAEKVEANIKFTDKEGKAYAANNVEYEVQLNSRNIAKGKATTNEQGEINISFLNNQPAIYKSGKIVATLTLPDKKKIVKNIPIKATSNNVDVQFFPESGNLVEGLPNKVGIKAVNASGLGEDVSGVIVDVEGTEVNKFETQHLGMGSFVINPQPGKLYFAKVKFKDGSEGKFNLPRALASGYLITVNSTTDNVVAKILMTADLVGKGELKLVALYNGNVLFVSRSPSQKQIITTNIPKKDLPAGIIQFTAFSETNMPIAERLVFVNNNSNAISATLGTARQSYERKEKVSVNLKALFEGKPVQGSFSVSVTNTASVKPDLENESNIFTSLLLSSDLAGYIEKPNYYFLNKEPKTQQDLDNLMLTQGWRRVLWKNVIAGVLPASSFQAEKSLKISGTVTTLGGKPVPNSKVSLFSSSGGFFAIDTLTDAQGKFNFDNMSFGDSTKFVVQARTEKGKRNLEIKVDVVSGQLVTKSKNAGDVTVNVNESIASYLKQSDNYFDELAKRGVLERTIMLKEVNIVEKKNPAKNSTNLNGGGNADAVITAEQLGTCPTLTICLQGRVAGLLFKAGVPYLLRNGNIPMTIMLDGMDVGADFLDNIPPSDVETIEVLKSINYTTIYGSRGAGGILVITTKRGGGMSGISSYTPGIVTYAPKGFYTPRLFYSPQYDVADSRPDFRSTIYWNPHVVTAENGEAVLEYYNSDETGTYRVVLEGIDMLGNIARSVYTYEVK
ncbi:carboxypeptidase-like regulatory domain-containing protein [Pedobacter psychroterrae]|uniref:TonB-dependent receptor n=1 Tax=Pedobacter psychroterrae TaxID=2530453 RepID=A0A4R0NQN0_9SPHI|nr:carboxypeptidase-like regulatory domain-containing protein [Pedobacter psychroterrae]TCD03390.1 TonB-dependent receptor [Pedobacter psychroterrae]